MSKKEAENKYINIHETLFEFMEDLKVEKYSFIRLGILLALASPKKKLDRNIAEELKRPSGARGYSINDLDQDEIISLLVSEYSDLNDDQNLNINIQVLANIGLNILMNDYYEDNQILWKELEKAISSNA